MKRLGRLIVVLAATGCSSGAATSTTTLTSAEAKSGVDLWAERQAALQAEAIKRAPKRAYDPLAVGGDLEASAVPRIEKTPRGEIRAKSPAELNLALGLVKASTSPDRAYRALVQRLGKPSWVEWSKQGSAFSKRRVWVAPAGTQCHRLLLEPDGSAVVESALVSEQRSLTMTARQSPCSGDITHAPL